MINSREEWLKNRRGGIGGSDAAAVIGQNPWKTNQDLWREKTGRVIPPQIDNEAIAYGKAAESHLIELFKLDFPEWDVTPGGFNIIRNDKNPFLLATLDGSITTPNGERGILEIKTTTNPRSESWKDQIPQNYYCQVLHYLGVTGWDFAILKAQIKNTLGDLPTAFTKHYLFRRADVAEDIAYLQTKEVEFWQYVVDDIEPPLLLPGL